MHTCKKEPLRVWWMCTVFTLWPCFVATFANSSVISSASTCGLRYQMGRGEQLWVEMFTPEVWRYTRHQPQLRNIEDGFPKIRPSYISDTPVTCKFFNPPYPVRAAEFNSCPSGVWEPLRAAGFEGSGSATGASPCWSDPWKTLPGPSKYSQDFTILVGGFIFFIFHNVWDNPSHWLIFFRGVETTNQNIWPVLSRTFLHTILLGIGRERAILDQK